MLSPLVEAVKRYTDAQAGASPFATAIPGLTVLRADDQKHLSHLIFKPALCVVVQGAKRSTFGGRHYDYKAGQALVVSLEVPGFSRIVQASPAKPYLSVVIEFDLAVMREVLQSIDTPRNVESNPGRGILVTDFNGPIADCVLRMMRLLDRPKAIPLIAPMIMREISYWLLTGPHGSEVAKVVLGNSQMQRVVSAIHTLRAQFAENLRIEDLAATAGMSPSAFHRQFKALTSMSPLQYQKQLRLLEARRLMMTGAANAESAAYQVGYESPSQFSREYSRMFGAPPRRDITTSRSAAA